MAVAAVSLSITVMILAIATGKGLQEKISARTRPKKPLTDPDSS